MKDNCEKCGWPMTLMAGGDEMHCGRKYYQNDYAFCLEKQNDNAQQENKQLKDRIKQLEEALEATAMIIGPPGHLEWATDDEINRAWGLYIQTKKAKL